MTKLAKTLAATLAAAIFTITLQACGGGGSSDSGGGREEAIDSALRENVEYTIVPSVSDFATKAAALASNSEVFCTSVDADKLSALQNDWKLLNEAWYKLALYNFGPLNDDVIFPKINFIDSMRERGTNYTATVRDEINAQITGSEVLDDSYFDILTFNKVGLLPLELLVFETSHSEHTQDNAEILAEYDNMPRKCEYLLGMSEQLLKQANYVESGWTTQFKDSDVAYKELFLAAELDDGSEPVATLLVSVQGHLDYLHKRHVANNAAQVSAHIWPSLSATIDEVEKLLAGSDQTTISFYSLMQSAGLQNYIDTVNSNISAARAAIAAQDIASFEAAVTALDGNFKREILDGLNVDPGINFTDGD